MSNTELAMVDHTRLSQLDDSLFSKELAPHYMKLAGQLANSEMVPKAYRQKPQDLFICWAMGYQVGLSPERSMQCIAVINGKPAMYGDELLALCVVHKDFVDIIEEPIMKDGVVVGYTCTIKRRGRTDVVNSFTMEMAKKAKLLGKPGPWTDYPDRMYKFRARGFSIRDAFPDAIKGIKSREEVEDYINAEYKIEDSPKSRTEILKKDITTKGANNAEAATQSVNTDSFDSDFNVAQTATENQESGEVVETGEQETEAHNGVESIPTLDSTQLKAIKSLIKQKQFSDDRLKKALDYYEAESIEELPHDLADHFISQLNKA